MITRWEILDHKSYEAEYEKSSNLGGRNGRMHPNNL